MIRVIRIWLDFIQVGPVFPSFRAKNKGPVVRSEPSSLASSKKKNKIKKSLTYGLSICRYLQ